MKNEAENQTYEHMQARLEEAWEELSNECKSCKFLNDFNKCSLSEYAQDEDCPLSCFICEQCEHSCKIIKDGVEREDVLFCEFEREIVERNYAVCKEFVFQKGDK